MAWPTVIANAISPFPDFTSVSKVPLPRQSAFKVPPTAWAFLAEVELDNADILGKGLGSPYYLNGVLTQEGAYMEPMVGQIWPR